MNKKTTFFCLCKAIFEMGELETRTNIDTGKEMYWASYTIPVDKEGEIQLLVPLKENYEEVTIRPFIEVSKPISELEYKKLFFIEDIYELVGFIFDGDATELLAEIPGIGYPILNKEN